MKFSAPSVLVFVISLVIAVIGALTALGTVNFIPLESVWIMAVAYAVLLPMRFLPLAASSRASDQAVVRPVAHKG
jgi:hypothetical protein